MALIINKSGIDNNGVEYPFLYFNLIPEIELHYDRVSINIKSYKGIDISGQTFGERVFPGEYWEQFYNQIHIDYEDGCESDLENWIHQKAITYLTTKKYDMCTYKIYQDDIFLLNEETGEIVLNEETDEPIILNKKGDLIKLKNGTYDMYDKEILPFCEESEIQIV
jgi:hypothetical protein